MTTEQNNDSDITKSFKDLAKKHGCDFRTVLRAIAGLPTRDRSGRRAVEAAAEWRSMRQAKEERVQGAA